MTAPARNFKKNAHTARFLMAFHTAGGVSVDAPENDTYEVPEHTGGGDGMVEVNRGRVAEDTTPYTGPKPRDARSEGQTRYMNNLIAWITEKDQAAGDAARVWTDNVTTAGKWSYAKDDKFSISAWIDRLKAKNAELNEAAKAAPVADYVGQPSFEGKPGQLLPTKTDTNGKPMALRYAVEIDGVLKFYKIKPGNKPGFYFIDVQASDELHPIRNRASKDAIVAAIIAAGPDACMARYGQEIGSCGRCGRTLTDAESRARGIGPDCLGKM